MNRRPRAAVVMPPDLLPRVFTTDAMRHLRELVELTGPVSPDWADVSGRNAEIVITGWDTAPLDQAVLDTMTSLRAIFHAGGSVKTLISPVAWERGITVATSASVNAVPVAEYCLAMVLLAGKNVLMAANRYGNSTDRRWLTEGYSQTGNNGRTVGIVGASRTGRHLAKLLTSCNVKVLCTDPYAIDDQIESLGMTLVPLDRLLSESSIVSLHAPHTAATTRMIGAQELRLMTDGATLINTARAALVDQEALLVEVVSGRLNAVLDVTEPEPLLRDHPLRALPNVLITPHVAGSCGNELGRLGAHVVEEIARYLSGDELIDGVTLADLERIA